MILRVWAGRVPARRCQRPARPAGCPEYNLQPNPLRAGVAGQGQSCSTGRPLFYFRCWARCLFILEHAHALLAEHGLELLVRHDLALRRSTPPAQPGAC